MITRKHPLSLQTGDDSSLVVAVTLPFAWVILLVAVVCHNMNMWEISLSLGRQVRTDSHDLTEGFYCVRSLFYRWGAVSQPELANPDGLCFDQIDFNASARSDEQETIDAYCVLTWHPAWDVGDPQANNADILDQVSAVLDDIDEFGGSLPY